MDTARNLLPKMYPRLVARQALYERFFFGPQHLMAAGYFDLYDKDEYMARVSELLARAD